MSVSKTIVGLIATLLMIGSVGRAAAQAWVKPRGGYYLKLSGSYLYTTEEFNFQGDRGDISGEDESRTDASFRDISFTAYLEYGLTDNLTLVADVPFKILTTQETELAGPGQAGKVTRTNGGLGDVRLLVRAPLLRNPVALSLQGGIKIPLGYEKTPDNGGPPLGSGKLDGELMVHLGLSLYPVPAYVSAGGGYLARAGNLHDEIHFNAEAGYTFSRLFLKLRFEGLENTHNPPDLIGSTVVTPVNGGGGTINDVIVGDQDIYKLLPTVSYSFTDTFAITGELFHTFAGKNTIAGTTYSLGLVFTR